MARPETLPGQAEKNTEYVRSSVRVIAVAGIPSGVLAEKLHSGMSPNAIPLVEVILARKNDTNLVTAIGGRVKPGEDLLHAAMNRVFEKTLLTRESRSSLPATVTVNEAIPFVVHSWEDRFRSFWSWVHGQSYHREAKIAVMPVRSQTTSLHEPREEMEGPSVYEYGELVHINPDELAQLFDHGSVETERGASFQMFGHLTLEESSEVQLTAEGREIQKREFTRIVGEIKDYEGTLRQETLAHINRERRWLKKPEIQTLGECGHEEIVRGFLSAKMVLGMQDEKLRDQSKATRPPKATDLPTAALFLREFMPADLPLALSSAMPREVLRVASALKYALRGTVELLYEVNGSDVPRRPYSPVEALRSIWPEIIALPPHRRMTLIRELDYHFIDELMRKLRVPREVITGAMRMPERLPKYLSDELQKIKDTFQELHPTNESSSAIERPFMQMLYILGLDPYANVAEGALETNAHVRTRGEILMHEAIIFSAIPIVKERPALDNYHFNAVLASILGEPQDDQMDLNGVPHAVFQRRTTVRIGDRPLWLWVDKRALKSEERWLMKSFQEPEVHDDFSYNFVILDENFSPQERRDLSARMARSGQLGEAILDGYRELYAGSGWTVSIKEGTHKTHVLQTVKDLMDLPSDTARREFIKSKKYGKRAGSLGDTIIREKFVVVFEKEHVKHEIEVCIYPFESVDIEGTILKGSDLMAFTEKMIDEASGRHNGERLVKTDPDDPTSPSVIELLYPAAWYRSFFDTIKLRQHQPTK